MVDIKGAVANAIEFARSSLGPERTMNIRPEEIEATVVDGVPVWLITLSHTMLPDELAGVLRAHATFLGADAAREYKVFTVRKDTGEVLSMKIRALAVPTMQ
jgi:hypothetical protein